MACLSIASPAHLSPSAALATLQDHARTISHATRPGRGRGGVQGRSPQGTPIAPYQLALQNGAGTRRRRQLIPATNTRVIRATVEDAGTGSVLQTVPPVHAPAAGAVQHSTGWAARIGLVRVLLGSDMHADMLYDPVRGDSRFERFSQARR